MTQQQLDELYTRIRRRMTNMRDADDLERYIAQLRAEVDAHDAALQRLTAQTQAPPGWHKLFVATPTLPIEIAVNGVPIPLHNGASTEVLP